MTAPAIAPETTTPDRPSLVGLDLAFLDSTSIEYDDNYDAIERDEKRLLGGDAVLDELVQFAGESPTSYVARKTSASYVNFLKAHCSTVTGRLRVHAPEANWGHLGEVRTRDQIDTPTFAELVKYNISGVGNDGMEFESFIDEVDVRAQATGWRWLFWEAPERGSDQGPPSEAEVRAGQRPYLVEWSRNDVPNHFFRNGQLQFAIVRVATSEPFDDGQPTDDNPGYYLLVRKGYSGFGPAFEGGGWWLFDSDKSLIDSRPWAWPDGEIPMWRHVGDRLMELGQIAVALMNVISMRDYDAIDAAASRLWFLNADGTVMSAVAGQVASRNVMIGVPPAPSTTGEANTEHTVTIYDGSAGAVVSGVFAAIVESKYREAQEQSIMQVTSIPSSSGESKQTGDREAKSPYLARRAAQRAQSDNTLIYFAEKRFGYFKPKGFSQWPSDFDLDPVVDDLEAAYDTLRRSRLKSVTLEMDMLLQIMEERGVLTPEKRKLIEGELTASGERATALEDMDRRLLGGGGGAPTLTLEGDTNDDASQTLDRGGNAPTTDDVGQPSVDRAGAAGGGGSQLTDPLNGAQITAAKDLMLSLRAQAPSARLAPEAAVELLLLVGVPRASAERMVAAQGRPIVAAPGVSEPADEPATRPAASVVQPDATKGGEP